MHAPRKPSIVTCYVPTMHRRLEQMRKGCIPCRLWHIIPSIMPKCAIVKLCLCCRFTKDPSSADAATKPLNTAVTTNSAGYRSIRKLPQQHQMMLLLLSVTSSARFCGWWWSSITKLNCSSTRCSCCMLPVYQKASATTSNDGAATDLW